MNEVVEGEHSDSAYIHVESGVPQGTMLEPLMFLCHINDLPDCVKCQVYAPLQTIASFIDKSKLKRTIKYFKTRKCVYETLCPNW